MRFQLWHDAEPNFRGDVRKVKLWLGGFRPANAFIHVADVETDELGRVFELTNHIDSDWTLNDGVTKLVTDGVRSTSVGDVVVDEAGVTFMVAGVGWTRIETVWSKEDPTLADSLPTGL